MIGNKMPLQNRVLPTGEIVAHPARGTYMGNRGILHTENRTLGQARWRHKAWIVCQLEFRDRHSDVMPPNRYTRLFFLDEAVAFSAGHRPCAECRRQAYNSFKSKWLFSEGLSTCRASDMDTQLHRERVNRKHKTNAASTSAIEVLPNGTFIRLPDHPSAFLIRDDALFAFRETHYEAPIRRPKSKVVTVLTPPSIVDVLRLGYLADLHPSIPK